MTLDERLEALTLSLELVVLRQSDGEERQAAAEERHTAAMERQAAALAQHEREMADIRREGAAMRADLRRAFSMGVREARHERSLRRALDEKITQLAAAQLVTEETLKQFIASMRRGENGNP
jgi:type II secretory pathway component PulJ